MEDPVACSDYTDEIWLPVVGFETVYSVSSLGRLKRCYHSGSKRGQFRMLAPYLNADGYPVFDFYYNGVRKTRRVHQVVAEAFIGLRPDGMEVNHKNGAKADNRPENLEYVTHHENILHAYRELNCSASRARGERVHTAKLTPTLVREARMAFANGETCPAIAKRLGVGRLTIQRVVNGKRWKHAT